MARLPNLPPRTLLGEGRGPGIERTCNRAVRCPRRTGGTPMSRVRENRMEGLAMHQIIYIVGAIVVVIALLSFVGLR